MWNLGSDERNKADFARSWENSHSWRPTMWSLVCTLASRTSTGLPTSDLLHDSRSLNTAGTRFFCSINTTQQGWTLIVAWAGIDVDIARCNELFFSNAMPAAVRLYLGKAVLCAKCYHLHANMLTVIILTWWCVAGCVYYLHHLSWACQHANIG